MLRTHPVLTLMPAFIKRTSDHGTANPIFARLSVQSSELLKFCSISDETREAIFAILHDDVQPRLLTCGDILLWFLSETENQLRQAHEVNSALPLKTNSFHAPHVVGLDMRMEQFLYAAKSAMRDIAKLFEPFFNKRFEEARYDKIYQWCSQQFGSADRLSKLIAEDQAIWIKRIVTMRNAVEHPGGHSGRLHIHNFEVVESAGATSPEFIEPSWNLNAEPKSSIAQDLNAFVWNALEFTEDLLILSMKKVGAPFVDFCQIPEQERDPKCPIRFRACLPQSTKT